MWFDLEEEYWMWMWAPSGTRPRLRVRDRYGDVLGLIPVGLDRLLDRAWVHGKWKRRPLGQAQELMGKVALELLVGAHSVWIQRCKLVNQWFRSPEATVHRAARILEMAARKRGQNEATRTRQLRKWFKERRDVSSSSSPPSLALPLSSSPAPGPASGAPSGDISGESGPPSSRLRRRKTRDPGFFITDGLETTDELIADAERKMMLQDVVPRDGTAALPFY